MRNPIIILIGALFSHSAHATASDHAVQLAWSPSPDSNIAGYKIYTGPSPGFYLGSLDCGAVTNFTLSNLVAGVTYYFAATVYTTTGLESDYSNEVQYTAKPYPPVLKTPCVLLTWGGPWTVETSTNLLTWSVATETPFNLASFPIEAAEPQRFYRVSTANTNLNTRITAAPQL